MSKKYIKQRKYKSSFFLNWQLSKFPTGNYQLTSASILNRDSTISANFEAFGHPRGHPILPFYTLSIVSVSAPQIYLLLFVSRELLRLRLAPHKMDNTPEILAECALDHPFFIKEKGQQHTLFTVIRYQFKLGVVHK